MNGVKGEVWGISVAEPMDLHQKEIWNHFKIFRLLIIFLVFSPTMTHFLMILYFLIQETGEKLTLNKMRNQCLVCKWDKTFWVKIHLTFFFFVPTTSSHLDVNRLIREATLLGLPLFLIYSCQKGPQHSFSCRRMVQICTYIPNLIFTLRCTHHWKYYILNHNHNIKLDLFD